jgi:hypothetical protein
VIKIIKAEPVSAPPSALATKALYDLLAFVTEPSAEVDARIYCWMNGWTLLPKVHDNAGGLYFRDAVGKMHKLDEGWPMFTYSVSEALNLVATATPGLGLLMLQHPNGNWSVAWSDDGPPKLDNVHFDPAFLPLAIVASVLEAMGQREARKQ